MSQKKQLGRKFCISSWETAVIDTQGREVNGKEKRF